MNFAIRQSRIQPTQRVTFDSISLDATKPITLVVKHAGETNPAYWSEVMKDVNGGTGGSIGIVRAGEDTTQAARMDYADRFARTVVTDWENVTDSACVPVPCTPDAVRAFFDLMIGPGDGNYRDVFDRFVQWCRNVDNFRSPVTDPVALGKK